VIAGRRYMKKLSILDSVKSIGKVVELYGWVSTIRDHKNIVFVDLKDKTGVVQLVGSDKLADVGVGSVIKISGKVKERPEHLVNEKIPTGKIEIEVVSF